MSANEYLNEIYDLRFPTVTDNVYVHMYFRSVTQNSSGHRKMEFLILF